MTRYPEARLPVAVRDIRGRVHFRRNNVTRIRHYDVDARARINLVERIHEAHVGHINETRYTGSSSIPALQENLDGHQTSSDQP